MLQVAALTEKEMRRLYGYLARRGFRSGDIFSVLEEMDILIMVLYLSSYEVKNYVEKLDNKS